MTSRACRRLVARRIFNAIYCGMTRVPDNKYRLSSFQPRNIRRCIECHGSEHDTANEMVFVTSKSYDLNYTTHERACTQCNVFIMPKFRRVFIQQLLISRLTIESRLCANLIIGRVRQSPSNFYWNITNLSQFLKPMREKLIKVSTFKTIYVYILCSFIGIVFLRKTELSTFP